MVLHVITLHHLQGPKREMRGCAPAYKCVIGNVRVGKTCTSNQVDRAVSASAVRRMLMIPDIRLQMSKYSHRRDCRPK